MLQLIETIFRLLFFCQPPILFYLNRKLNWRIKTVPLVFLSFFLGWVLCLPVGLLHSETVPEAKGFPVSFVIFAGVFFGWFISGMLLLLWSPVITFFVARNRRIKRIMALVTGVLILSVAFLHYRTRYDWGVAGNHLLCKATIPAGFFDCSFVSVFAADNDLLKQKLINKWQLQFIPAFSGRSRPVSYVANSGGKPDWWPSDDVLENLEGYSQVNDSDECYRSLWYDPSSQRLYLERGHR